MPSLSSIEFLIGEALGGLARNRYMAVAAIITAAFSLAISAGFAVTALAVNCACHTVPQKFDMAVYIKNGVGQKRIDEVGKFLKASSSVDSVKFVSREEAWKEFKKTLGTDISTEDVVYNPALATYKVRLSKPEMGQELVKKLNRLKQVDSVLWRQNEVRFFGWLARLVAAVGLITTVLLFLGSAFIIANTIRLGIYARRREIAIMRLVGARPSFIRLPFLLEGMILSGAGAVMGAFILRFLGGYLGKMVDSLGLSLVASFFNSGVSVFKLTVWLLAIGILLGAVSSQLSIRRYLREGPMEASR